MRRSFSRGNEVDPKVLWDEAMSHMKSGDFRKTAEQFTEYLRLKPDKLGPYLMRGQAYQKLNRLDDAIKDFTRALELEADNIHARYLRAQVYALKGEAHKAAADYTLVLDQSRMRPSMSPNRHSIHLGLGVELHKLGRYQEAKFHLEEVLAASPNNETAQRLMRQIHQGGRR